MNFKWFNSFSSFTVWPVVWCPWAVWNWNVHWQTEWKNHHGGFEGGSAQCQGQDLWTSEKVPEREMVRWGGKAGSWYSAVERDGV